MRTPHIADAAKRLIHAYIIAHSASRARTGPRNEVGIGTKQRAASSRGKINVSSVKSGSIRSLGDNAVKHLRTE